jgi:hypothetical protein
MGCRGRLRFVVSGETIPPRPTKLLGLGLFLSPQSLSSDDTYKIVES